MKRRFLTLAGAAVVASALLAPGAGAATIVVTGTDDEIENGGICSLREAVTAANTNGVGSDPACGGDTAGADTIVLTGGLTYAITRDFAIEDANVWADLDITGPTTITTTGGLAAVNGNNADPQISDRDRVFDILNTAGSVTLNNLIIQSGWSNTGASTTSGGGGVRSAAPLTIIDSEITGNHARGSYAFGGGVRVLGPLGSLTMSGTTVAGNTVLRSGAALAGTEALGGGVMVYNGAPFASITNSTISGNTATGENAVGPGLVGGAFFGDGGSQVPTTLINNTITLNNATLGGAATGGLQIVNGTMSGNIVAGNTADNSPQDCFGGPTTSLGANIIGIDSGGASCGSFDLDGPNDLLGTPGSPVNPNLGGLLSNGGLTRTHALNPGSPAIDLGGTCPETDQRGFFRAPVAPCDSGAFELNAPSTLPTAEVPPAVVPTVSPTAGPTGQRARALKKCKKIKSKPKRRKCKRKANRLPV